MVLYSSSINCGPSLINHYFLSSPRPPLLDGGLLTDGGALNGCAGKVLSEGNWAGTPGGGGLKAIVMDNPPTLQHCTPSRAAECAKECTAKAHDIHAKRYSVVCSV